MKICVVTHTFPRYQGEPVAPFMEDFCRGLAEEGHDVVVLTPYHPAFRFTSKKYRIKHYRYIFPDSLHLLGYSQTLKNDQYLHRSVFFLAPFMFIFCFMNLLLLAKREHIDVISAHWIVPNGFLSALVSKLLGIPLVVTVPGSDMYLAKKNKVFRWMAKIASEQASVIASNSMNYLDEFPKFGIEFRKTAEIPYGVDVKKYKQTSNNRERLRKKYGYGAADFVILSVGRLVEKKGFEYLIKAMKEVVVKHPAVTLAIIGSGSLDGKLKDMVARLRISKNVQFIGKVNYSDLPGYYSMADVYTAPSIVDSQGNLESHIVALFEAIASALPAVVTDIAASERFVKDGVNGYRVPQKNPHALAQALVKLYKRKDKEAFRKESLGIASDLLSYRSSARAYTKLFDQLQ